MKTTIKKLEKSEVEIIGTLESEVFEKYEEKALNKIGERLELPGFRKGKAPANIVKENIPEMELLEEMAEQAITDNYSKILEENKIDAIGRPEITITKIGKGSELEFKIITATLPELKLGDYKKIASVENKKEEHQKEVVVEDAEVEKVILDLRKMRAEQTKNTNHEGHENLTEEEHAALHKQEEIKESDYPPFDDEFAKSFGDFKNTDELKEKIKNNLKIEKETEKKDKLRLAIIEELVKETKGEIPEILINAETDKILYRLEADIAQAGFKFEDYLKQINKTEDDLRKEWQAEGEKRAKLQMIIHLIAKEENLKPTDEEIEKDVENVLKMYKEADPTRARAYVEQMLENEKVFAFLENQKQ
ncbi:MAG: trigger factor [Candidatus Pacebacteria bacterium]|nr:trigger factor [Candidatus Paceibacterota bacterium]